MSSSLLLPASPVESALIGLWMAAFGTTKIHADTDFFLTGGSEAIAAQLLEQVKRVFAVPLAEGVLLQHPTPRALARVILQARSLQHSDLPILERVSREQPLPLSYSQERMWFVHQLEEHSTAYNVGGAVGLRGPLHQAALQASLDAVILRNEALRTVFPVVDGRPMQVILPFHSVPIEWIDLRNFPERERRAEAIRQAEACTRLNFDLEHGPLLFMRVLELAEDDHIFAINMHHIITDAWAMAVFAQQLTAHYNAYVQGAPLDLPVPDIQYADYAVWQRKFLDGERIERQLAHWLTRLQGLTPVELPASHPRPAVQTYNGSVINVPIPPQLLENLQALGQSENATPFMVFLAAFYLLLYRYTNQEDLTVAVPIANRNWSATENMLGSLVNTLLMRANLAGEATFRDWLRQVRQVAIDAYDHQDMPYARLVAALQPERDSSRSPLAQMMFNMVNVPFESTLFNDTHMYLLETDRLGVQFDLSLNIHSLPGRQQISLEYNTDLFDHAAMQRLVGHYQQLLESAWREPDKPVNRLPMLTQAERAYWQSWNATQVDHPEPRQSLVDLWEAQAAHAPDAVALLDQQGAQDRIHTYREVDQRANALAERLRLAGIHAGDAVALCIKRSYGAVPALLGILKTGAVYVPLDPAYPVERLAYMLVDSGARALVGSADLVDALPAAAQVVICLDADGNLAPMERTADLDASTPPVGVPAQPLSPPASPHQSTADRPLYILYTSGSTGQPKGVVGSQRAAINRFAWMWRTFPFQPGEVACQKTALSFVDSVWELFGPLLRGVSSVIIADEVVKDPPRLVNELARRRVTRIVVVPSLLAALLDAYPGLRQKLPDLRLWISSGEALPVDLARRFAQAMPHATLLNLYGSSEVAGDVSFYDTAALPAQAQSVPLGRPMDNICIYILDPHQNLLPVGIPGEIVVGGANLSWGYHQRPELTAQKFQWFPALVGEDSDARYYRTGDRGYLLEDGTLAYLGRLDHQVKLRGMRIELDEIETVLAQHPSVRACAVTVREQPDLGAFLAAYVVSEAQVAPTVEELRAYLRAQLPEYMLPARWLFLEDFPRTPNGKIDRKALPMSVAVSTANEDASARNAPVSLEDPLERQIAQIWEEVLEVVPVRRADSFFDLGGHSLLGVKLLARLQERLGIKIPVMVLFQSPTVAGLASAIRENDHAVEYQTIVPLHARGARPPLFFVHGFGGGVTGYADLARAFGVDQPLYGLQSRGLNGITPPLETVEEMAAAYIQSIQTTIQPHGPYYLGGYCFGGTVAYEMACQLRARGEPVALVALLETYPTNQKLQLARLLLPRNAWAFLKNFPEWIEEQRARRLRRRARLARWADDPHLAAIAQALPDEVLDPSALIYPGFSHVSAAHLRATLAYQPGSYAGVVDVFRVHAFRLSAPVDDDLGWGRFAMGGTRVHVIPGGHDNLLEAPNAAGLALAFHTCLDAAMENYIQEDPQADR